MNIHSLRPLLLIALIVSVSTPVPPVHAAAFTVTNLNDSGAGSLRQAIADANAASGADTITFSVSGTIILASTLPSISDSAGLTINGAGQVLTISGNNAVRVMQVDPVKSLTLHRVTIANGNAAGSSGGGIYNEGTLTITNTTFSGNSAAGFGGGIYNSGNGTLTITNSTFSGNSAADIGLSGGGGGGIYNGGTFTITNSTFSGNSTLSAGGGGGIHNIENPFAPSTITNSTFSGNSAPNGSGGGILNDGAVTAVTLRNTIVANSVGGNCGGPITNGGNNLDDGITCGWGAVSGSMSSTNPLLGALANNFAETQTFALLTGSPAIDGVTFSPPNSAPATDQRGVARPQGGGYDIGAFEVVPGSVFVVNTSADTDDFFCDVLGEGIGNQDCTLREAIDAANALFGPDTITFSVSGTITLASMLPTIDDVTGLTIDGNGQTLTVSGNNAVRVMQVSGGASLTLNNVTIANGASSPGGGVLNLGSVTITNSTFSGNSAGGGSGGGIYNIGTLTITNGTFSGNSASPFGFGGGIFTSGTLTITNSTFSGNSASGGGAGIHGSGAAEVTLRNTIVANSVGSGNCGGAITNGGNNIDSGTTCGWGAVSGSMSSSNPLLGTLANNGGPTQTFALLTGSPAIHGVTVNAPNSAPSTDQRGLARPQGVRYDIGAYEFTGAQAGPAFMVNVSADTNDGSCNVLGEGTGNLDCTLREAITAANALAGADTITFSVSGTIALVGSQLPSITDAAGLTIDGTGQTLTISGNNAVRVMQVDAGASLTLNEVRIANGSALGGGGIYNSGGTLTITNSTFSGNRATGGSGGGGIVNTGTLAITNSTFSGNSAGSVGGGIFNSIGTLTITNSTFSGNSAGSVGGGIFNNSVDTAVTLRNTIVANSVGGNCGGPITNGGNNIDDGTTCGWGAVSGSMSSTNPLLGALANNGGPTQTFALLTGSPAIDGVTFSAPNSAPSTDQRGFARPKGVRYDIGSYEYSLPFTDDPLTAGTTIAKAVHITELRTRIDAVRIANGLLAYGWNDLPLVATASLIRAQHIIDLRTALGEAYVAASRTPPTYATDPPPSLAPGVAVKAAHIAEIRTALLVIE